MPEVLAVAILLALMLCGHVSHLHAENSRLRSHVAGLQASIDSLDSDATKQDEEYTALLKDRDDLRVDYLREMKAGKRYRERLEALSRRFALYCGLHDRSHCIFTIDLHGTLERHDPPVTWFSRNPLIPVVHLREDLHRLMQTSAERPLRLRFKPQTP